jgi:antitoxin (DNA-binding transcriptional repressor) of toxin-antitoxin stability system
MGHQISKSKFKAKALEIFRQAEASGDTVVVTYHGRPVPEVRPCLSRPPLEILRGTLIRYVDPTGAVHDDEWSAGQ